MSFFDAKWELMAPIFMIRDNRWQQFSRMAEKAIVRVWPQEAKPYTRSISILIRNPVSV
ncbi:hypothetical protein CBM2626_A230007 [Cupriavidus taiwanensis]|nr:hypothetical protein CBM2626_A230007 [Cupriavidus taiwanensis]